MSPLARLRLSPRRVRSQMTWLVVFGVLCAFSLNQVLASAANTSTAMAAIQRVVRSVEFSHFKYVALETNKSMTYLDMACGATHRQFMSLVKHADWRLMTVKVGKRQVQVGLKSGAFPHAQLSCQREHIRMTTPPYWLSLLLSDGNLS